MLELVTSENLLALFTLTALEIVLGIDNIVFIAIVVERLPEHQQALARRLGLLLAMFMRIALLLVVSWVMGLTKELFTLFAHAFSGRDLILIFGGLFLISKATVEIHGKVDNGDSDDLGVTKPQSLLSALLTIVLLDVVFSLDSVITAVGMAEEVSIMIASIVIAVLVMLMFAEAISRTIRRYPTLKMLALSFLLLIGLVLVADGWGQHISKGYIYFAMGFSLLVELLNIRVRAVADREPARQPSKS